VVLYLSLIQDVDQVKMQRA